MCKDEDGCQVVLALESKIADVTFVADTRLRLALLPDNQSWSTSPVASLLDDNDAKGIVAEMTQVTITCTFGDAEDGVNDSLIGFSLRASNTGVANAVCTLVLID